MTCYCNKICYIFLFLPPTGAESTGTLCLCERGERQPVCVSGRVCAGVCGDALTEMEASAGPDCMGHTPHYGLHLYLQQPHHPALGPGNLNLQHSLRLYFCCK